MKRAEKGSSATSRAQGKQAEGRKAAHAGRAREARAVGAPAPKPPAQETGYVDLALASYAADTTGTITLVATIAQGASVNQRIGKKVTYKSVQIHGQVYAGTAGTVTQATCLLVYDKRPTGSLPNITDVLNSASTFSFNNDTNSGRFRILRRWDFELLGNITTPATGLEGQPFHEFVNLKGYPVTYKAAGTGAIGDIEEGAVYFITVGVTAAGTGAASVSAGFRTRFLDVPG